MKGTPVKYNYETNVEWTCEKKGILKSKDKPNIEVACPPDFGGHAGIWSPEDLFVASVEVCMLTTFLWFIKKEKIDISFYKSKAMGAVKLIGGVFRFSSIDVKMKIDIPDKKDLERVKKILKKVKRACLISNSIDTEINIDPEINIG